MNIHHQSIYTYLHSLQTKMALIPAYKYLTPCYQSRWISSLSLLSRKSNWSCNLDISTAVLKTKTKHSFVLNLPTFYFLSSWWRKMSLADLPFDILYQMAEYLLVKNLPIETDYISGATGTGGRWPLPYRRAIITRSDLALLSTSKAVREAALRVFWTKNTFLYCPRSKENRKVCTHI